MSSSDEPNWRDNPPAEARIIPGLFRSRNFIWDNDHRIVERHGISWSQFLALSALRSAHPECVMSPTQLYTAAQVTSGGMTKMLHGLTDTGYVTRTDNPADKRSRLVKLTAEGREICEVIVEELNATNKDLIGGILSQTEAEKLAQLLRKLSTGLQHRMTEKPDKS